MATFRALSDGRGEAKALHALSEVQRVAGQYEGSADLLNDALAHAKAAQRIAHSIGDIGLEADALIVQGAAHRHCGRWLEASRALESARVLMEPLGALQGLAGTLWHLAMVRLGTDQPEEAATLLQEALPLVQKLGDQRGKAQLLLELGKIRTVQGRLDDAEALLHAVDQAWTPPSDHAFRAQRSLALGLLRQRMMRYDEAAAALAEAVDAAAAADAEALRQQSVTALDKLQRDRRVRWCTTGR